MAVLLVVLAHAGVRALPGGFVGVDVFFVVSGFLITGLLLAEACAEGSVSLLDFYVRRARRILPAAALTLVATDVAAVLLLNFLRARDAVQDSVYAAAFSANFRFTARGVDYFARNQPPSPLLHTWSLGVEEQFYIVWPTLFSLALFGVVAGRRRRPVGTRQRRRLLLVVLLLGALSLAWSVHRTATLPPAAYFSPFTRAWELGIGAALAVGAPALARTPPPAALAIGWAGLAGISASAVAFSDNTPFPGSAALLPTAGTALVIAAGIGGRQSRLAVGKLLSTRPIRVVGDRSYGYYLWHWPVLILAEQYAGHGLSVGVKLGLTAGAFLLSCVSYALVENPIRRRARSRGATGAVFAVSLAAVLGTAGLALGAVAKEQRRFESSPAPSAVVSSARVDVVERLGRRAAAGAPGVLPEVVASVRAARRGEPIPTGLSPPVDQVGDIPSRYGLQGGCVPVAASSESTSRICRVGRAASRKTLVLVGDSHAQMWLPAVLETAWRDGWAVVPLLRPGCTPGTWATGRGPSACRPWFRWVTRQVALLRPRVALVTGSFRPSAPAGRAAVGGIVAMARALEPASGRVVVIGDPRGVRGSPVDCILSRHASMATCTTNWSRAAFRPWARVAAEATRLGFGFVDTVGWFCLERRCPVVIGRTIAYRDGDHVGAAYAARLAAPFRAALRRAARSG